LDILDLITAPKRASNIYKNKDYWKIHQKLLQNLSIVMIGLIK